jgi:hypothetical protein
VTGIEDPIEYGITVRSDTDHEWKFRRKDGAGIVLHPTKARAEIRSSTNNQLWQELTVVVLPDGWISVNLPRVFSDDIFWKDREKGEWDLLVTYKGKVYRWVEGPVTVDIGVTQHG